MTSKTTKFRNGIFGEPRQLPVMRCTTRNGLTMRVVDNRESYRRQRAIVGYEQVVPMSDKWVASTALRHHHNLKTLRSRIRTPD